MLAPTTPIYELEESFFVPRFRVKVAGRDLPDDVVQDVIQVTYKDSIEEIDSFDLVINNYETDHSQPHHSEPNGYVRSKYEPHSRPEYENIFDPGQEVEVWLGYGNNLRLMLTGQITTLEPNFPASGGLTLSVRGLNVLHTFRTEQHTQSWTDTRDSDIATELGRNPVRQGRAGLGIEVRTNPVQDEPAEAYVLMNNQYDIVFLMERARRRGYELVLREEDPDTGQPRHLYFGPSESRDDTTYLLEWGKSLVSFRPTLTTARQVSEVVVIGWDRRRNRRIEERATWQDLLPRRNQEERSRQEQLAQAFGSRSEIITDRPVHTAQEARNLARSTLRDLRKGMVEADGETIGLPGLRAGRNVQVTGLGARFSGSYYIKETTHTIGENGYKTTFKARREEGMEEG